MCYRGENLIISWSAFAAGAFFVLFGTFESSNEALLLCYPYKVTRLAYTSCIKEFDLLSVLLTLV